MNKLELIDLHVNVEGKEIIRGINLTLPAGKIHALIGPNGSGKSTLANAIMGHPKYKITSGSIILNGKNITAAKANLRAKEGLFLSFQYPSEISGLSLPTFLRTAVNNLREEGTKYSVVEFHAILQKKMKELGMDPSFSRRDLNAGFSGGEKKKMEILQLAMLEPRYALLDETDSGLDVDSLRSVAQGIKNFMNKDKTILLITHYKRILDYVKPDVIFIMKNGKIVRQGSWEMIDEIEKKENFKNLREEHMARVFHLKGIKPPKTNS